MVFNIFLMLFIIFMTYWWSSQGLFSALLHLISVIIAGSLALALWEPIALGLLMKWDACAPYARGLGLCIPFVALLLGVRYGFDRLIGKNVNFMTAVSMVGGGILGLMAAILTGGLMVISLNFLPLGVSFAGYQPLQFAMNGQIEAKPGHGLWIAVDTMTEAFFNKMSVGAFSTSTPLRDFEPGLAKRAQLHRTHLDEHSSVVALPGTVTVDAVQVAATPVAAELAAKLGPNAGKAGYKVIVVGTTWNRDRRGTYDRDQTLRVASTQVRLATIPSGQLSPEPVLHAPVAVSMPPEPGGKRHLEALDDAETYARGLNAEDHFKWVFVVPDSDKQLKWIFLRQLRMGLTPPTPVTGGLTALLGTGGAQAPATQDPTRLEDPTGRGLIMTAIAIDVSNRLPVRVTSSSVPATLRKDKRELISGSGLIKSSNAGGNKNVVDSIRIPNPKSKALVRLRLDKDGARSIMGAAIASAASIHGAHLYDSSGNVLNPIAYIWQKENWSMYVAIDFDFPITSTVKLPVRQMKGRDQLYLYYLTNLGSTITEFRVGSASQRIDLLVEHPPERKR
jgi:hypothetical protein